jgi:hypothetical protein
VAELVQPSDRSKTSTWDIRERCVRLTKITDLPNLTVRQRRRYDLKRKRVACYARKVVVPDPFRDLLTPFDTNTFVRAHCLLLLLRIHYPEILCKAGPDNQDIAKLELGALVLGDGLHVGDGDFVRVKARVCDPFGFGIGFVVDEDAAGDETAAFMPV